MGLPGKPDPSWGMKPFPVGRIIKSEMEGMKHISIIMFSAVVAFAACSKLPTPISPDPEPTAAQELAGIRINANIVDIDTRSSLDVSAASWKFAFTAGDVLRVDNSLHNQFYSFTFDGSSFFLKDSAAPAVDVTWYAYYPAESVDLTGQAGTLESAARLYSVSGLSKVEAGSTTVDMDLFAESSILVVKNTRSSEIRIGLKRYSDDKYVSGLIADDGGMVEVWSDSPVYLATIAAGTTAYVVVPAYDGKCAVVEEQHGYTIRQSGATGLVSGKYYNISVGNYTYKGSASGHDWVELSNGVKYATMNIGAEKVGGNGDFYFWGDPYLRYSSISGTTIKFNTCPDGLIDSSKPVTSFTDSDFAKTTASQLPLGTVLSGNNDIATVVWGPKWRMMSDSDAKFLIETCAYGSPCYTDPVNNMALDVTAAYAKSATVTASPRIWLSGSDSGGYHVLNPGSKSIAKAGGSSKNAILGRSVRAVVNE